MPPNSSRISKMPGFSAGNSDKISCNFVALPFSKYRPSRYPLGKVLTLHSRYPFGRVLLCALGIPLGGSYSALSVGWRAYTPPLIRAANGNAVRRKNMLLAEHRFCLTQNQRWHLLRAKSRLCRLRCVHGLRTMWGCHPTDALPNIRRAATCGPPFCNQPGGLPRQCAHWLAMTGKRHGPAAPSVGWRAYTPPPIRPANGNAVRRKKYAPCGASDFA